MCRWGSGCKHGLAGAARLRLAAALTMKAICSPTDWPPACSRAATADGCALERWDASDRLPPSLTALKIGYLRRDVGLPKVRARLPVARLTSPAAVAAAPAPGLASQQ